MRLRRILSWLSSSWNIQDDIETEAKQFNIGRCQESATDAAMTGSGSRLRVPARAKAEAEAIEGTALGRVAQRKSSGNNFGDLQASPHRAVFLSQRGEFQSQSTTGSRFKVEAFGGGFCLDSRVAEFFQSRFGQVDSHLCSIPNGVFSAPDASLQDT